MIQQNIKITISFYGEVFDINYFSQKVGIDPTNCWLKGDVIQKITKKAKAINTLAIYRKETCWEYSISHYESIFVEDALDKILNLFKDKISNILFFLQEEKINAKIDIVLMGHPDNFPAIYFPINFLKFVTLLNADIDIDTYIVICPHNSSKSSDLDG